MIVRIGYPWMPVIVIDVDMVHLSQGLAAPLV
jgi:hypothetical protein